jgi:hypothetical protein
MQSAVQANRGQASISQRLSPETPETPVQISSFFPCLGILLKIGYISEGLAFFKSKYLLFA